MDVSPWVPLDDITDSLVGEREGHAAAVLVHGHHRRILCLGGFKEGDSSEDLLLGTAKFAPDTEGGTSRASVSWTIAAENKQVAGREGACVGVHPSQPDAAFVVGGMSSDLDVVGDVWKVALEPHDDTPSRVTCLCLSDTVDLVARYRHCMVPVRTSQVPRFLIFGGESTSGAAMNDIWSLTVNDDGVEWEPCLAVGEQIPQPRFLAFMWTIEGTGTADAQVAAGCIAGGAHFVTPGDQQSMSDAWSFAVTRVNGTLFVRWELMEGTVLERPRNGGAAVQLSPTVVALVGGKDAAIGTNSTVLFNHAKGMITELRSTPVPDSDIDPLDTELYAGRWPHWRYQTAAVSLRDRDVSEQSWIVIIAGNCRHPDPNVCYALPVHVGDDSL
jgi:hypothetical protein